jgi:N-acetylneuraminic acid mutarotase
MTKRLATVLLLAALAATSAVCTPATVRPQLAAAQTYDETFASTTLRDAARTTAVWDTVAGQLRLPPPAPASESVHGQLYRTSSWSPAVRHSDGLIYLFGGSTRRDGVQTYDPATNSSALPALTLPFSMRGAAAVYAEARQSVYLFGGGPHTDVVRVNLAQMTTSTLEDVLPAPLSYAAAVYVPGQDKAYLFGGLVNGQASDAILRFDLVANTVVTLPVSLPSAVTQSSAIYDPLTDSAYVFGGERLGFAVPAIWKFDVGAQTVTSLGTLPEACSSSAAVYVPPDKVYLFGGQSGPFQPLAQIVAFDISQGRATTLAAQLPEERSGASAAYVPSLGRIYVLGGEFGPTVSSDVLAFDVSQGTIQNLTVSWGGRDGACGAYVPASGQAYLFGGRSSSTTSSSKSIVALDTAQGAARTLSAELPSARRDAAAAYVPTTNRIYVFGGVQRGAGGDAYFSDVLRFDTASESVSAAGVALPSARAGMSAVYAPDNGKVYLFGGVGDAGTVDDILAYDAAQNQLATLAAKLPEAVAYAAAAYDAATAKIYLFGGQYVSDDGSAETWVSDIVAFDIASETAALLSARLPTVRSRAAAFAVADGPTLYVVGGSYPGRVLTDICLFDPLQSDVAVSSLELAEGRAEEVALYVPEGAMAYLFGGVGSQGQPKFNIGVLHFVYPTSATAQSLKVSQPGEQIHEALLYVQQSLRGGAVSYSLSNNGGQSWANVYPGVKHEFPTVGSDLRWRAVLSGAGQSTPVVDRLTIYYNEIVQYRIFLPVIVKGYSPST